MIEGLDVLAHGSGLRSTLNMLQRGVEETMIAKEAKEETRGGVKQERDAAGLKRRRFISSLFNESRLKQRIYPVQKTGYLVKNMFKREM